jgi:hypothetical protein
MPIRLKVWQIENYINWLATCYISQMLMIFPPYHTRYVLFTLCRGLVSGSWNLEQDWKNVVRSLPLDGERRPLWIDLCGYREPLVEICCQGATYNEVLNWIVCWKIVNLQVIMYTILYTCLIYPTKQLKRWPTPAKAMQVIRCTSTSLGRILKFSTFYSYFRPPQRSMSFSSTGSSPSQLASSTPSTPRPSASLVIVNERNEILLVRRNPKATAFGGMHVRLFC